MQLGALLDPSPTSDGQRRASAAARNRTSTEEKCRCSMETRSYPISVRVIGVMHKEKSKMYMTSVLWSDHNEIVVYRTFREFKKMHKQMKKAFPKLNKNDRIIPRFRDKKLKRSGKKKSPTRSLVRLKFLQKYCNELLSCDPRVSQSADLIQFFHPKAQDLQPDFSRNSVMVMPSEEDMKAEAGQCSVGNVTQPFITETYRCVAPYETKDTKNKPFKVAADEKVDVLIKDKAGWWLVESEDKRMAWFPAPYLEKLEEDGDEDDVDGASQRGMLYVAVKSYKATKGDEATVAIGAVVEVLQKSENGWWLIRYKNKVGYVPTLCLQPYNSPQIRMSTGHHGTAAALSGFQQQANKLSSSQGNLLQLPSADGSPSLLQPHADSRQRSRSLNVLSVLPPAQPGAAPYAAEGTGTSTSTLPTPQQAPPPAIMVEMDGEGRGRSLTMDSEGSFMSDSTDFSFSDTDELASSAGGSSLNLSVNSNALELRHSRTPPPMPANRLSPIVPGGNMTPSVSDPNIFRSPSAPKVPPRPQAREILTRCTSITRKNASRGTPSPTHTEMQSR
eukprot:XP_011602177.1 PREDICTED: NADPH oxidase organizer 1 [Takifugu rubripes]